MQAIYYFGNDAAGNAVLPAVGVTVSNQNAAPIRSIIIDNGTNSWLFLKNTKAFVAPQTIGYIAAYTHAITSETIIAQAPSNVSSGAAPGVLVPTAALSGSSICIIVSDEDQPPSPGTPYGIEQGPILGSKGQPIEEVLANVRTALPGATKGEVQIVTIANVSTIIPQSIAMANATSILLYNTDTAKTIYWAFGTPTVGGTNSFPLLPGAAVSMDYNQTTNQISAIVAAGSALLAVVQIAT